MELEKHRKKFREETAKYRRIVSTHLDASRIEELLVLSVEELQQMDYSAMVGENHGKR